jgi:hypothetical protein
MHGAMRLFVRAAGDVVHDRRAAVLARERRADERPKDTRNRSTVDDCALRRQPALALGVFIPEVVQQAHIPIFALGIAQPFGLGVAGEAAKPVHSMLLFLCRDRLRFHGLPRPALP